MGKGAVEGNQTGKMGGGEALGLASQKRPGDPGEGYPGPIPLVKAGLVSRGGGLLQGGGS